MPTSFMTLFPPVLNSLEAMKIPIQASADLAETAIHYQSLGFDLMNMLSYKYQTRWLMLFQDLIPAEKRDEFVIEQ